MIWRSCSVSLPALPQGKNLASIRKLSVRRFPTNNVTSSSSITDARKSAIHHSKNPFIASDAVHASTPVPFFASSAGMPITAFTPVPLARSFQRDSSEVILCLSHRHPPCAARARTPVPLILICQNYWCVCAQDNLQSPGLRITHKLDSHLFHTSFYKYTAASRTHPKLFALSQKFASLGTYLLSPFSDYIQLPAFTGWGYSKDLPRFAGKSFGKNGSRFTRVISACRKNIGTM